MTTWQKYGAVALASFLAGLIAMYAALNREGTFRPMVPGINSAPTHTRTVTVKAYDKAESKKQEAISSETAKDPDKEVLATGKVKTSDGTKTVTAVVDVKTGDTALTEHRAFGEWMSGDELGIGYGLVDGDLAKAVQYRHTFARIWKLYGTVQLEAFQVERAAARHPWNAMLFINYRW